MIGCWPDSNTPEPSALCLKACLQRGQVEGGCRRACRDLDLHDGAGVRAVAGQDGRCAGRAQVRGAGVVVVAGHPGREGGGRIVVEDQGLAGELREVDDHVGPLGRRQQQGVLVHVADVEAGRVGDPGGRLVGRDDHRGRQEAAFGADLDPARARRAAGWCRGVGKTTGSVCAAATSAGFSATSLSVPGREDQRCTTAGSRSGRWPRSGCGSGRSSARRWSSGRPCR